MSNPKISDLAWLEGTWSGTVNEDEVEEIWGTELGGQRHGMFRWLKSGKPFIYEWLLLGEFDGNIQMRIRHARPDATGIEEKSAWTEFTLQSLTGQKAVFLQTDIPDGPRLIFERSDSDLRVWFEFDPGTPPVKAPFLYKLRS